MIDRPDFLKWLWQWKDKNIIKVITGIRRCGKSTLFDLFQEQLIASGTKQEQIIAINFEDHDFDFLRSHSDVWSYLKQRINPKQKNYIFLDEIQRIPEFERVVDGLYVKKYIDVYITGSNAFMLSSDLTTFLSGRYVENKMMPLSFREYLAAVGANDAYETHYRNYLHFSSFPYAVSLNKNPKMVREYLAGIYTTIVMKDIIVRKGFKDYTVFERVVRYLFDNIGNLTSVRKISDTLTSSGHKTSYHTIAGYIEALCESYLIYQVNRYDVKGREYLKTGHKYYLADLGLRYFLLGNKGQDEGHILENIVFLELLRRWQNVYIGKVGKLEVDFITQNGDETRYFQVAASVRETATLNRELAPLLSIRDHHPKTLITLDHALPASHDGIKQISAFDFLLQPTE